MSKKETTKPKATTTKTVQKRPVGRPKKTAATNVTVTKPKQASPKATATRELTKAVKGKTARPTTTPPLYDAKAAFDLAQNQITHLKRKVAVQNKAIDTLAEVSAKQGRDLRELRKIVATLVEDYNDRIFENVEPVLDEHKPLYKRLLKAFKGSK